MEVGLKMDGQLEHRAVWEGGLELRQDGREIVGRFPYGSTATIANTGRVRKERFRPGAFRYSIERADWQIDLLSGHSFDRPIASKLAKSLTFNDTATALEFRAVLPVEADQPSWVVDTVKAIRSGLSVGISPGFRVPPKNIAPNAERLIPEPGNPDVLIRELSDVLLPELSIVTRAAYPETGVSIRSENMDGPDLRRFYLWL